MPHGVLSSELACDAVPSRVALSSELRATAIVYASENRFICGSRCHAKHSEQREKMDELNYKTKIIFLFFRFYNRTPLLLFLCYLKFLMSFSYFHFYNNFDSKGKENC